MGVSLDVVNSTRRFVCSVMPVQQKWAKKTKSEVWKRHSSGLDWVADVVGNGRAGRAVSGTRA